MYNSTKLFSRGALLNMFIETTLKRITKMGIGDLIYFVFNTYY